NPTRRSDFFSQSRGVDGARSLPLRGHKPLDPDQGLGIDDAPGPQVALQVVEGDLDDADDLAFAQLATSGATPGRLRDLGVVEDDAPRRSPGGHVEGGDMLRAVDLVSALPPPLPPYALLGGLAGVDHPGQDLDWPARAFLVGGITELARQDDRAAIAV